MNLPSGGRLVLPWPQMDFLPSIPPLDFPRWLGLLPGNPFFWLLLAGLILGAVFALWFRFGKTPQQKVRLHRHKVFWIPLGLAGVIGLLTAGALITRTYTLNWDQGLQALGVVLTVFLALRFPRLLGIPLGLSVIALTVLLGTWTGAALPADGRAPLLRVRLLGERPPYWTLETSPKPARIRDLPQGQWVYPEVWELKTPGLLSLSGAQRWILLEPQTGILETAARWTAQTLGLEKVLRPGPPAQIKLFQVYLLTPEMQFVPLK